MFDIFADDDDFSPFSPGGIFVSFLEGCLVCLWKCLEVWRFLLETFIFWSYGSFRECIPFGLRWQLGTRAPCPEGGRNVMGGTNSFPDRGLEEGLLRPALQTNFFEEFEIGDLLGSGSFGQVRKCWPVHDSSTKYAVKAIDTKSEVFELAGAWLSARKEASILQSISHPYIVKLIDVFEKERWLFLVMDLMGGPLFQALANPRIAVTEGCCALIGSQLLQALEHLHLHRIVHRDVKAENIMLLEDPGKTRRWHIKLIDFGLALRIENSSSFMFKMCQQEPPLEHLVCGTAYYCAPEVWFHDYSFSVDVWAAGVVLYLALFGQFPFHDRDPARLEVLICEEEQEPAYRPICAQDHPTYQVSNVAQSCLKQLLTKAREDRPDATTALGLEWLAAARKSYRSKSFGGSKHLGPTLAGIQLVASWDQVIPPTLRAKAGRAALPPQIAAAAEERRTQALEAVKMRSNLANLGKVRKARPSAIESWSVDNPLEVDIAMESKGVGGLPILHDVITSAYSDSEEELHRPMSMLCSCEHHRWLMHHRIERREKSRAYQSLYMFNTVKRKTFSLHNIIGFIVINANRYGIFTRLCQQWSESIL